MVTRSKKNRSSVNNNLALSSLAMKPTIVLHTLFHSHQERKEPEGAGGHATATNFEGKSALFVMKNAFL